MSVRTLFKSLRQIDDLSVIMGAVVIRVPCQEKFPFPAE